MAAYVRYTGAGYCFGVPSKDLTKAEWEAIPAERRKAALKMGTHEIRPVKKDKKGEEESDNG